MILVGCGVDGRELSDAGGVALHVRRETTADERDYVFKKVPKGRAATLLHAKG